MPDEFETFIWNQQTRYKCNRSWEDGTPCEYDTYDLATMQAHAREPHNVTGTATKIRPANQSFEKPEPAPEEYSDTQFKK